MLNLLSAVSIALAAASTISGLALPIQRDDASSTSSTSFNGTQYSNAGLEDYNSFNTRYVALDCKDQVDTDFFNQCCYPLQATEGLATLPSQCIPPTPSSPLSLSLASSTSVDTATWTSSTPAPVTTSVAAAAVEDWGQGSSSPSWTSDSSSSSDWVASTTTTWAAAATSASSTVSSVVGNLITGGFGTYFYQNGVAGSCGTVNPDDAVIVAMDTAQWNAGDLCGKQVQITNLANQKSVVATVADTCPTCNNDNSIDMSVGAFTQIADEATGLISISWSWMS